jgi:tRNA dimethylallyltransferase
MKKIGILTGPTATGKSSLAIALAAHYGKIEIINADSLLVYRGMDIGTAKPTLEEQHQIPHHLIDIKSPNEPFTAGEFVRSAITCIDEIHKREQRALIVGGTGFYLKALLYGLWEAPSVPPELRKELEGLANEDLYRELESTDPQSATRIGKNDRYRLIRGVELTRTTGKSLTDLQSQISTQPDPRFRLWILDRPQPELDSRIELRTKAMIQQGLIQEFKQIQSKYPGCRPLSSIGYAQVGAYLEEKTPQGRKIKPGLPGLKDEIQLATRQLVKNQRTWLRSQHAKMADSKWFHLEQDRALLEEEFKTVYE